MESKKENNIKLKIIIESRGKKEDELLRQHFQKLLSRGTNFVTKERLSKYNIEIEFKSKKQNDEGLQISDLVAYPIARDYLSSTIKTESYKIIEQKYYRKGNKLYGRKIFPQSKKAR